LEDVEDIFERIKAVYGFVPRMFQILSKNPELLRVYFEKSQMLMISSMGYGLSLEEIEMIATGAAAALGSEHCLDTHLEVLKSYGVDEDKVLCAILIGGMIAETSSLSKSLRNFEGVYQTR